MNNHKVNSMSWEPGMLSTSTNLLLYDPCGACKVFLTSYLHIKTSHGNHIHLNKEDTKLKAKNRFWAITQ